LVLQQPGQGVFRMTLTPMFRGSFWMADFDEDVVV
jgi:hypothetical protein